MTITNVADATKYVNAILCADSRTTLPETDLRRTFTVDVALYARRLPTEDEIKTLVLGDKEGIVVQFLRDAFPLTDALLDRQF